jgi:uncharacterized protein
VKFEWDPRKAATNLAKHGVAFTEALTVFADPLARIFDDEEHSSIQEKREIIVGHSSRGRPLLVCFTERREEVVRIFAEWKATKKERSDYEEDLRSS